MRLLSLRFLSRAWLGVHVLLLVGTYVAWFSNPESMRHHVVELLVWAMSTLGFHSTRVWFIGLTYSIRAIYELTELLVPGGLAMLTAWWAIGLAPGYVQWFVVLPALVRWLRRSSAPV